MTSKKKANATVVTAKVRVCVDVKNLVEEQIYLKFPDACEIVIERVDWDDTMDWLDNDLENLPITVEIGVNE